MRHLLVCREYPPAVYPPGGIGTYALHVAHVLAEAGETVHVIGERWEGAPRRVERLVEGRLVIHRIAAEDADLYPSLAGGVGGAAAEMRAMLASGFPAQWFSWVAAGLAERLVTSERIDVIEGQEWEAPLYYFMLRRALGLGPARTPPCIVHLHSPTEFIFRHNDWPLSRPDYLPMKRLEDFVIRGADALLCPSRYLADQCTEHYGLDAPVEVIPLPLGGNAARERSEEVWAAGPVCFCGRLEPRKGVIEFVDAAVAVARRRPELWFDLVGSDNEFNDRTGVRDLLLRRIPEAIRHRFVFHGGKSREEVLWLLGRARMAVVPSRWENFPNTCLEAMSSGLPVLATRNGGMAEMIEDGRTGWLAADGPEPLADRLAAGLERAVATPPAQLAAMGQQAAEAIRALCGNGAVAARHVELRAALARAGASRSLAFPSAYPWPEHARRPVPAQVPDAGREDAGTGVAVLALRGRDPTPALAALALQTRPPRTVVVVSDAAPDHRSGVSAWHVAYDGTSRAIARDLAVAAAEASRWVVLEADTALAPRAIEAFEAALARNPAAGLAVSWGAGGMASQVAAPPSFPYQWVRDELCGPMMIRTEALRGAGPPPAGLSEGHEGWALATAAMAAGWQAVRVPGLLSEAGAEGKADALAFGRPGHAAALIAAPFAALAGLDALPLIALQGAPEPVEARVQAASPQPLRRTEVQSLGHALRLPLRDQARLVALAARRPDWAAQWVLWRARSSLDALRSRHDR